MKVAYDEFRYASPAEALVDRFAGWLGYAGLLCVFSWAWLDIGLLLLLAAGILKLRPSPVMLLLALLFGATA